jgi:FkbM family methyltransferase
VLDSLKRHKVFNNQRIKSVARKIWHSRFGRLVERSHGDWRYPFLSLGWWLAGKVVPRKKVRVEGISFNLSCTNWITHFRWYLFHGKEPEVRYFIDEYLKDDDVFFDIGANVGVFSIYAAMRKPGLSVYCFEPEVSNMYTLKENIIHNGLTDRVKINCMGISDKIGYTLFHLSSFEEGSAVHTESREKITTTDEGFPVVWSEGIISVTLDYICKQLQCIPNALKIDTDGNEPKILDGALNLLSNETLRCLIVEMSEEEGKRIHCQELLKAKGFCLEDHCFDKTRNEIWVRK